MTKVGKVFNKEKQVKECQWDLNKSSHRSKQLKEEFNSENMYYVYVCIVGCWYKI